MAPKHTIKTQQRLSSVDTIQFSMDLEFSDTIYGIAKLLAALLDSQARERLAAGHHAILIFLV